jgi:hypothetical protein
MKKGDIMSIKDMLQIVRDVILVIGVLLILVQVYTPKEQVSCPTAQGTFAAPPLPGNFTPPAGGIPVPPPTGNFTPPASGGVPPTISGPPSSANGTAPVPPTV